MLLSIAWRDEYSQRFVDQSGGVERSTRFFVLRRQPLQLVAEHSLQLFRGCEAPCSISGETWRPILAALEGNIRGLLFRGQSKRIP
jgi:hypothetical protein